MKSRKTRVLLILILAITLFGSILVLNTLRFNSKQIHVETIPPTIIDESDVASRLAQALRFQTVSHQDPNQTKVEEFLALHRYLERTFPKLHAVLSKEVVGDYSLR